MADVANSRRTGSRRFPAPMATMSRGPQQVAPKSATTANNAGGMAQDQGTVQGMRAVPSSTMQPRQALALAASGQVPLTSGVLESLLASMALGADKRAGELGTHFDGLVHMLLTAPDGLSPEAALKMITSLGRLQREQQGEARRTVELLAKILRPGSPTVKVTAANAQVNVDLGGQAAK